MYKPLLAPMTKKEALEFSLRVLFMLLGAFIMALGNMAFLNPFNIVPGGFTGFAIILNKTLIPFITPGVMALIMNVPLFIAMWKIRGRYFTLYSLIGTVSYAAFIDLIPLFKINMTQFTDNPLLAVIYGGVLMGIGYGLIIRQGGSTGGSDSLAMLFKTKKPNKSFGTILLAIDGLVVVTSAVAFSIKFGSLSYGIPKALYAFLVIFLSAKVADYMIEGKNSSRMYYIVCHDREAMARAIMTGLDRGCTALDATGMFTHTEKHMLMCVVLKSESQVLKRIIFETDPQAFVFASAASEVYGEGFIAPPSSKGKVKSKR